MYFLPRDSRLYATIVATRPVYRYCGTLLSLLVLVYGWYGALYIPAVATIALYEREALQMRDQYARSIQARISHEQRMHAIGELKTKTHVYTKGFSSSELMHETMTSLLKNAHMQRCEVTQCRTESARDKGWYTKQVLALDITGDLLALNAFLVKKDPTILARCHKIILTHDIHARYQLLSLFNCLSVR